MAFNKDYYVRVAISGNNRYKKEYISPPVNIGKLFVPRGTLSVLCWTYEDTGRGLTGLCNYHLKTGTSVMVLNAYDPNQPWNDAIWGLRAGYNLLVIGTSTKVFVEYEMFARCFEAVPTDDSAK